MNHMRKVTLFLTLALITLLMVGGLCFGAEKYPTKPIQVIVPFAAGGSSDLTARTVEKFWTKYSPQPMLIVNKPGAGGVLGEEYVVRSKPDGYTIYVGQGSGHDVVMPHLQKMPFDPLKDITPVARLSIHSIVICVSGKSPINSMKDLIEYANKGNKVTAAVSTAAGSVDLVMRAISKRADIPITTVPFAGGAESTTALAGGHLTIGGGHPSEVMPHLKAGRFKAIGVALDKRDPVIAEGPDPEGTGDRRRHLGLGEGCRRPERHAARDRRIPRLDPEEGLRGPGVQEDHGLDLPADRLPEHEGLGRLPAAGVQGLRRPDQGTGHQDLMTTG